MRGVNKGAWSEYECGNEYECASSEHGLKR